MTARQHSHRAAAQRKRSRTPGPVYTNTVARAINGARKLAAADVNMQLGIMTASLRCLQTAQLAEIPALVRYRNADTGETWTGRGLKPRWLVQALANGKNLSDFEQAAAGGAADTAQPGEVAS